MTKHSRQFPDVTISVMYIRRYVNYCVIKMLFINKRWQHRSSIVQTDHLLLSVLTRQKTKKKNKVVRMAVHAIFLLIHTETRLKNILLRGR